MSRSGSPATGFERNRLLGSAAICAVVGVLSWAAWIPLAEGAGPLQETGNSQSSGVGGSTSPFWGSHGLAFDYNTLVVWSGAVALGAGGGVVGVFLLLRKQALLGDVVSHAALPGVGLAFLVLELVRAGSGKWVPGLLLGAALAGFTGIAASTLLRRGTRLKDDAVLAVVLSVYFGLGIVLLTIVQRLPGGNQAGLPHFIYGKAAALRMSDVQVISAVVTLAVLVCLLLFKELRLLAFDERFAAAQGWPVVALDLVLKVLVVAIAVVGLQGVGLLLVVAVLIVPPAAARFWTERLDRMVAISAAFGALAGLAGVAISASWPRVATGATIALCDSVLFALSMALGVERGLLRRWWHLYAARRRQDEHHLLRACYELLAGERGGVAPQELCDGVVRVDGLVRWRGWSPQKLRRLLERGQRRGWIRPDPQGWRLTPAGAAEACRHVRNHRLWELYLVKHADVAIDLADRRADDIEHVLDPELVAMLEEELETGGGLPSSPHRVATEPTSATG
ncbi:MAG: manganese ABC transporter permease [Pirellulaceae bacterium]|nr:MAG: manganese ABC transporter permease [Pirellulaceae bacterium]